MKHLQYRLLIYVSFLTLIQFEKLFIEEGLAELLRISE
jgi:hypothetical protein